MDTKMDASALFYQWNEDEGSDVGYEGNIDGSQDVLVQELFGDIIMETQNDHLHYIVDIDTSDQEFKVGDRSNRERRGDGIKGIVLPNSTRTITWYPII